MGFLDWVGPGLSAMQTHRTAEMRGGALAEDERRKRAQEDEDRKREQQLQALQMALMQTNIAKAGQPGAWQPTTEDEYARYNSPKAPTTEMDDYGLPNTDQGRQELIRLRGDLARAENPDRFRPPRTSYLDANRKLHADKQLADELIAAAEAEPDKVSTIGQKVRRLAGTNERYQHLTDAQVQAALTRSKRLAKKNPADPMVELRARMGVRAGSAPMPGANAGGVEMSRPTMPTAPTAPRVAPVQSESAFLAEKRADWDELADQYGEAVVTRELGPRP